MKPWVTWADLLTGLRVPLAVAFPFVPSPAWRLALVVAAAASDFFDGMLARRLAWATAGVGLYAIWDYGRAAARSRAQRAHGRRGAQRQIGGA